MKYNQTMKKLTLAAFIAVLFASCGNDRENFDASGTFEAVETSVSAQANGTILSFDIEEGQVLQAGQQIGYIDSVQLSLRKQQLLAQIQAVLSKSPDVAAQIAALEEQLKQARHELKRVENLAASEAATQKNLDDARAGVEILEARLLSQRSSLATTSSSLKQETLPLMLQVEQLNDQLEKCRIINPVEGTVLVKYAEAYEMASVGKPLYKIADLSNIDLKAYITGGQFSALKLGQPVTVFVDEGPESYRTYEGTVEWISNEAEFTPKTIMTKEERANLVYATRIRVENDGLLKIGMYGEVKFSAANGSVD